MAKSRWIQKAIKRPKIASTPCLGVGGYSEYPQAVRRPAEAKYGANRGILCRVPSTVLLGKVVVVFRFRYMY